jgi:hypothetical protein
VLLRVRGLHAKLLSDFVFCHPIEIVWHLELSLHETETTWNRNWLLIVRPNILRQRIVKIVGDDEIALCETKGTLSCAFRERANLGYRLILFEQNDGLTFQYTMKILMRILLDFLDGGIHIVIVTSRAA